MESFVDICTTSFQAVLAVCVVFTAGYAYNGKQGPTLSIVGARRTARSDRSSSGRSQNLIALSRNVLLPCLLLTAFASSSFLTWRRLLSCKSFRLADAPIMLNCHPSATAVWPIPVIALIAHVASLGVSLLLWRYGSTPDWMVETLTYNKWVADEAICSGSDLTPGNSVTV